MLGFHQAICVEASLLVVALGLSLFFGYRLWANLDFSSRSLVIGVASTGPMFALLGWLSYSSRPPLVEIREFLEARLAPTMRHWTVAQLLLLSLVAGLAEETLFRDLIQGTLTEHFNPVIGVLAGSVLFGLCHAISKTYAVIAFLIGAYLGLVWLWSGSLVAPVVAHALYDFIALVYLLRYRQPGTLR